LTSAFEFERKLKSAETGYLLTGLLFEGRGWALIFFTSAQTL
jgi:hypothetical protein